MPTRILMVCLGNICRSPLAEGIMASKVNPEKIQVDSAGTAGYHVGNLPDPRSIQVAKENEIDITHQRSRQFTELDFDHFDLIYAMDQSNYSNILSLARSQEDIGKVSLLLEAGGQGKKDVPDPYYGGQQGFENVFRMINDACEEIVQRLESQ